MTSPDPFLEHLSRDVHETRREMNQRIDGLEQKLDKVLDGHNRKLGFMAGIGAVLGVAGGILAQAWEKIAR